MSDDFINRIRQVILNHINDEKIGVRTLSSELGLSRSLIFLKIKAATGKTVNQFIKEVRLLESVKLIEEEKYTAAEIAYKVGFTTPQYFSKCFHDYFGITPGKLKKHHLKGLAPVKQKKPKSKFVYLTLLIIIILILGFNFSNFNSITNFFNRKVDIAVLPIDDLSEGGDQEWFVAGITEEIRFSLSQISEFNIKSGLSSQQLSVTSKSYREIAKDLKVDYIICGCYRQEVDSLYIIVELIKSNGEIYWMKTINEKNEGVLSIQRDIANQVAQGLKNILFDSSG